jgi:hypothetical protein
MSDFSIYPDGIDGYAQLPLVVDNVTRIDAVTVNRLRSAIVKIETELGTQPSGDFETVKARLDALENTLVDFLPPLTGQQYAALVEDPVGEINWVCLRPSYLCDDFSISSFSSDGGSLVEVGASVVNPGFSASYTVTPDSASVIDNEGGASLDVSGTPTSFSYAGSYTKNTPGASVNWTLSASQEGQSDNSVTSKTWTQKVYFGVGAAGQSSEAFIKSLTGTLATTRNRTFTVTAGASEKIYYAYRSAYGDATFTVGGFEGGFFKVSGAISITNDFGFTENYTLYESDNLGLGTTTVVVT